MDTLIQYRGYINQIILEYSQSISTKGDCIIETIIDTTNDRYLLIIVGWDQSKRIYEKIVHINLYDGEIWIEFDSTDGRIVHELIALGVPENEIVLAFHSPAKRRSMDVGVDLMSKVFRQLPLVDADLDLTRDPSPPRRDLEL